MTDIFDLSFGPDELTGQLQVVRIERIEPTEKDLSGYARFHAIGGGPTNVPRWKGWPSLVYSQREVTSMLKTGVLKAV